jgi:DNA-binding PadR family transcriptional regulator
MVDDTFNWNEEMDDALSPEERYALSDKGKRARQRARKKYDKKNPEERKRQKRDYMRRKRKKDKNAWR